MCLVGDAWNGPKDSKSSSTMKRGVNAGSSNSGIFSWLDDGGDCVPSMSRLGRRLFVGDDLEGSVNMEGIERNYTGNIS